MATGTVQRECQKLSSATRNLLNDSHQKQKDIEALFQSLERLEKVDKVDMELGMDQKTEKAALAGKVSHTQFEASLKQLNERNQEVLSWLMVQEQQLQQVQQ
ncbi:glutamine-rich protein 2-like isoform X2 [Lathamus discolor]|uniref:glutamine-rich protein 2-like isoform X2 n=1 Tax=Lathamus discolor TaxID=678569 RepID=UPI0032B782AF